MKKILVVIDDSDYSKKVLKEAKVIAEGVGCGLTILHVIDLAREEHYIYDKSFLEDIEAGSLKHCEEFLKSAKETFEGHMKDIETICKIGDPAEEIINYVEYGGYDLVIMGSRGAGAISGVLLGSVSSKVVHEGNVSVLIVK